MKRIYISGKITGTNIEETKSKFNAIENAIKSYEYEVFNPFEIEHFLDNMREHHSRMNLSKEEIEKKIWNIAMSECFKELLRCDTILMLEGWKESKGAKLEFKIAKELGITIMYEKNFMLELKIRQSVLDVIGISNSNFISDSRDSTYVLARKIYANLLYENGIQIKEDTFRDRTTFSHYIKNFKDEMKFDKRTRENYEKAKQNLEK